MGTITPLFDNIDRFVGYREECDTCDATRRYCKRCCLDYFYSLDSEARNTIIKFAKEVAK